MTDFLVRRFIKDYEETERMSVRTAYGVLASVVGIFCNFFLFAAKLLIGLLLRSVSVQADAFNNLSDAASSVIGLMGVKMAAKPADKDHPFGHGRMEYIAALVVSFLVIQVGFSFFGSAVRKIIHPEELVFRVTSIAILVLSVFVKLWLSAFNRKLGKRIDAKVLLATAADAMGDVAVTSATILSLLFWRMTGINIDGFVGLGVAAAVVWAGFGIAKDTLEPLIGQAVDPEIYEKLSNFVESYDGIVGSHDLIVHNYGPGRSMASIHAEVPNDVNIEVSHEIIDLIEREAIKKLGIFLVIHMDPVETKDERVLTVRGQVEDIVEAVDDKASIHDFRMVEGKDQINLIFDMVVPFDYDKEKQEELKNKISRLLAVTDKRYVCVISVEKSFVSEEKGE